MTAKLIIEEPCENCNRVLELVDYNLCEPCHISMYCECGRRVEYEESGSDPIRGEYVMCRRCD